MSDTTDKSTDSSRTRVAFVTALALGAVIGGFLFGFDTSTMNSAINGITPSLNLNSFQTGTVTSIALIGSAVGAWFSGDVSERIGRTKVMMVAGILILLGSLGALVSGSFFLICLVRLSTGLGIGAASAVVPSYVNEVSPPKIRGTMGTFWQMAIVVGQFLGLLSGYLITSNAGSESTELVGMEAWRWMFAVVAVFALVYVIIALRLPQSPPDAVRLGDTDSAHRFIEHVGGGDTTERFRLIRDKLKHKTKSATFLDLRGSALGLKKVMWTGLLLAAFQQLVGINVVKTYSNTIWQSVGISAGQSFFVSMFTIGLSVVSTVIAILIMDRVGRRTMLVTGGVFMVPALLALTIAFAMSSGGSHPSLPFGAGITAVIGMNVFAVAFGITWGPVMWLMLGELFDSDLRTIAVAVCTAVNWVVNWLITLTFPILAAAGLSFAYGLYTIFAILALIFALKGLPETKGKKLS